MVSMGLIKLASALILRIKFWKTGLVFCFKNDYNIKSFLRYRLVMNATIVDLRYKTKEILKALDRNEMVSVSYHGKLKGIIKPVKAESVSSVEEHPFFGSLKVEESPLEIMERLRGDRYGL